IFGHEDDQKAPTFVEAEQWFEKDGKGLTSDEWLQHWLVFATTSFLCQRQVKSCVCGHSMLLQFLNRLQIIIGVSLLWRG
ncbi:unnamed protein product, partial [Urochloa humidicola]